MKQATVFVAEQRTNVGAECAVVRSGGELAWHFLERHTRKLNLLTNKCETN